MNETLSQSLTPEEDEAVQTELGAIEAASLQEQMHNLPDVPKVCHCASHEHGPVTGAACLA